MYVSFNTTVLNSLVLCLHVDSDTQPPTLRILDQLPCSVIVLHHHNVLVCYLQLRDTQPPTLRILDQLPCSVIVLHHHNVLVCYLQLQYGTFLLRKLMNMLNTKCQIIRKHVHDIKPGSQ